MSPEQRIRTLRSLGTKVSLQRFSQLYEMKDEHGEAIPPMRLIRLAVGDEVRMQVVPESWPVSAVDTTINSMLDEMTRKVK